MAEQVSDMHAIVHAHTHRFAWTNLTPVFRSAEPPFRPNEVCGVVSVRAALRRTHQGIRGRVRVYVKPHDLEAAVDALVAEGVGQSAPRNDAPVLHRRAG